MENGMHWGADWHAGWFLGMHLAWWIFWIVVAVGIWAAVSRSVRPPASRADSPIEVLQRRYAEGALTTAEYEERRAKLTESASAAHRE
jgi:putative membrane protein